MSAERVIYFQSRRSLARQERHTPLIIRHSREGGNPCLVALRGMGPRLRGDDEIESLGLRLWPKRPQLGVVSGLNIIPDSRAPTRKR